MSGGPAERVLVVDYRVPHFDQGGGDPRMDLILHTLRELWPGLSLTLAVPCADGAETYGGRLREAGVEVVHGQADWAAWFAGRRFHYGIVLASRTHEFEPYIRRTQPQALRVLDVEALFFRRLEQRAAREGAAAHRSEAARVRAEEVAAIREADVVWCVSEEEKVFVESVAPTTPSCFVRYAAPDGPAAPGFTPRRGLVFLGSFIAGEGSPNEDAALHLVGDVMPGLWRERPGLPLAIVGARPTAKVTALHGGPVEVTGYAPDPRVLLSAARVFVAPIRVGAGVKLKLVESMAAGLPFVTTPRGAEGLGLGALAEILVAEDSDGIAARVRRLYDDRDLWERVRAELAALYARRFSPRAFREELVDAMAWAGVAPP
jgi:glycosyltransferase involved in cell wall biosynthesis